MIRFTLKCAQDHSFESWFASGEAFETLCAQGHVTCPSCGDAKITKSLMAPRVRPGRNAVAAPQDPAPLSTPESEVEKALARMKAEVEKNSDYVGMNFATEARAIHDGDAPARPIYGEAKLAEAKALIEDGVAVTPLPFTPTRKAN